MENKGVFFDVYGTLLIYGDMNAAWSDWLSAFHGCLKHHGLDMPIDEFSERCDRFFGKGEPPAYDERMTVFERRIRVLCDDIGLGVETDTIQNTASEAAAAWEKYITPDPDAIPVLRELEQMGKTLAIVSNFDHPPHIRRVLSETGLAEWFELIVISGEVGVKKPDPGILSLALARTGLSCDEVIYVGDTTEDVEAAIAAGMRPVLIQRESEGEEQESLDFTTDPQGSEEQPIGSQIGGAPDSISALPEVVGLVR